MGNQEDARSAPSGARRVSATNRSVAIGGGATHTVIVTGDGNAVTEVTMEQFESKLAALRDAISRAAIAADDRQDLSEEIEGVARQAAEATPSKALVLGKLRMILGGLKAAGEAGAALVPAARWLAEAAVQLF